MNALLIALLATLMVMFPTLYFVGVAVISSWAWTHVSRGLIVGLFGLFVSTVLVWAFAFALAVEHGAPTYLRVLMIIAIVILAILTCIHSMDAFQKLREDKKPLSLSEVVEASLR